MPNHLPTKPSLTIVSDTHFWQTADGATYAHEPTLREVEALTELFEPIYWIGFLQKGEPTGISRKTEKQEIKWIPLPQKGGNRWYQKLLVIAYLPLYLVTVIRYYHKSAFIHTRLPSVPGILALFYSYLFRKPIWNKYAGNWEQPTARSYRMQKAMLVKAKHTKVTVNGSWPNQASHIHPFWNPCLTEMEYKNATLCTLQKKWEGTYTACFIGRIESEKGIHLFLNTVVQPNIYQKLNKVFVIGNGRNLDELKKKFQPYSKIHFTGERNRDYVDTILAQSHFLGLPSQSEGFPKVIAEAAAYGAIPISSDVSAIKQFIHNEQNGFLYPINDHESFTTCFQYAVNLPAQQLGQISVNANKNASVCTYTYYLKQLKIVLKNEI